MSSNYQLTSVTAQVICHCLTCRKVTGSTNSVCLLVPSTHFTFLSSSALKRIITKHETGMELELNFCGDCGSLLCKEPQGDANQGVKIVFAGTLDGDNETTQSLALDKLKPEAELWVAHRVSWLQPIEGAAQLQGFT